jgi:hypothetical protein
MRVRRDNLDMTVTETAVRRGRRPKLFDAKRFAFFILQPLHNLEWLKEEHPDRFDAVIDVLADTEDFSNALNLLVGGIAGRRNYHE